MVRILEESNLEPRFLELELTESSIMSNADATIEVLSNSRAWVLLFLLTTLGLVFLAIISKTITH